IVEKPGYAVKNIAAGKEAAEDLRVAAVNPLATELKSMLTVNERQAVTNVGAPEDFVNGRLKEEWLTETESCAKAHRGVGNGVLVDGVTGTILARVRKMRFVELGRRDGAIPVAVGDLNFGGAFDAVGSGAISRNIESLVGILGPVVAVGTENLIL